MKSKPWPVRATGKASNQRPTVKQMVREIVQYLNVNDERSSDLWDILTALRGPDNGNYQIKSDTTSRIRAAIKLKPSCTFAMVSSSSEMPGFDSKVAGNNHFAAHYNRARSAILRHKINLPKKNSLTKTSA